MARLPEFSEDNVATIRHALGAVTAKAAGVKLPAGKQNGDAKSETGRGRARRVNDRAKRGSAQSSSSGVPAVCTLQYLISFTAL